MGVILHENFDLIRLEYVAASCRMSRDLGVGVIPPHYGGCMFSHPRPEQSASFPDVVDLRATASNLINNCP
ncbi:unnamed protein product [Dibothriocephalus latus]|uniref:Uncharacterized protein n=1 Tax=Dibothriocephalus latus TaxID=60516 RepID=A0A3P7LAF4_DIBLA|nr:unnamed protein product [Dibothriocephalus latus]